MRTTKLKLKYNGEFVIGGEGDHEHQIANHWNIAQSWTTEAMEVLEEIYTRKKKDLKYDRMRHALANIAVALFNQAVELTKDKQYSL